MVQAVGSSSGYPFLDVMWTMLVFFMWVIWFWLLIIIFTDLFRRDLSGWAKAGWVVFLIILPYLGVLIYLITQSKAMGERRMQEAKASQSQFDSYVRNVSGGSADQIAKGKELLDSGAITPEEYDALKRKALTT
jgi:Short C-terminal domain/Phospholipase_D-nuclease N-terminal